MKCPINKSNPDDCRKCPFSKSVIERKKFFNAATWWLCKYPYIGDVNYKKLKTKVKKQHPMNDDTED